MGEANDCSAKQDRGTLAAKAMALSADGSVRPQDLLITEALAERPRRDQNLLAEIQAMHNLAQQLATRSEGLLNRLAELAVELCDAGSAGVSLLEQSTDGDTVFRWAALAGAFKPYVGGFTPRAHSPCGLCLDRKETILLSRPQRVFQYFNEAQPPIVEGLIAPLFGEGGHPLGTIWIVSHDPARLFDAGTAEVVSRLGAFTTFALQMSEREAEKDRLVLRAQRELTERKRTEQVLRESEARLRHQLAVTSIITDNTASALFLKDGAGCPTFMNPAAERMFGYTLNEIRGRPLHESIHHTHPDGTPCPISECPLDQSADSLVPVREHETFFVRKDGSFFPVSCSVAPLARDGNTIGSVLEVRDITERKHAEEELQKFRSLVENSSDFIGIADLEGRAQFLNTAARNLVGLRDTDEIQRTHILDYFIEDDRPLVRDAILPQVVCEGRWVGEIPFRHFGTGEAMPVYWAVFQITDRVTGDPIAIACVAHDLRERKAMEEALRAGEERLRFALKAGRLGWWELDLTNRELNASAICKANFGRGEGDRFSYGDLLASIHSEDRERQHKAVEKAIAARSVLDVEYRAVWPDGNVRWIHIRGQTSCAPDGTPIRMAGVSLDVTARKQAEENRELLMRELDHRVKNILATVQAVASQTLPRGEVAEALRGRIGALAEAQKVLAAGDWEKADLRELVRTELAPYRSGNKQTRVAGPAVQLPASAAQTLALVLHELATNAAKYGALSVPEGLVDVKWEVRDEVLGPRLSLVWAEAGGPTVTLPTGKGFGSRLIENSVIRALGGNLRLEFQPDGLRCELDIPIWVDRSSKTSGDMVVQ